MRFFLLLITLSAGLLSGCDDSSVASSEEKKDGTPVRAVTQRYSISGQISQVAGIAVDSDINDKSLGCLPNNAPEKAQKLEKITFVQGFASAVATGGTPRLECFANWPDKDDFYKIKLDKNQQFLLHVIDASSTNDLDLFIYSASDQKIAYSQKRGEEGRLERINISEKGEYLINVRAQAGKSKYILEIASGVSSDAADFIELVEDEAVVQYKPRGIATTMARGAAPDLAPKLIKLERSQAAASTPMRGIMAFFAEPDPYADFLNKRQTLIDIKNLDQEDDVEYAEPNLIRRIQAVPNDPGYNSQWHYNAINLEQAWDIATGESPNALVTVAVIDTGVFLEHPDLKNQLVDGYDFILKKKGGDDLGYSNEHGKSVWHGTHVAGTIAAQSNNLEGVAGVSWGAKIMPLRALGKDGGTSFDISQAIRYAAGLSNNSGLTPAKRADIINMSLGSPGVSTVEKNAITAALNAGVILVAAAGNYNTSVKYYPAAYPGVIAVAATNFNGQKASYSNFGSHISLAAPGGEMIQDQNRDGKADGIYSTYVSDSTGSRKANYALLQGTSMATPHVAGVLALMKSVNPGLTPNDIKNMIENCELTATTPCERNNELGYGLIDGYRAVDYVAGDGSSNANLTASQNTLQFNSLNKIIEISIENTGSQKAENISLLSTPDWLKINTVLPDSLEPTQKYTVRLEVDLDGLDDGSYSTKLTLNYNISKKLFINVILSVGNELPVGVAAPIYVMLENAECDSSLINTDCVIDSVLADENGYYQFDRVAEGRYRIYAGSDIDVDGLICQEGELCGAYPSYADEEEIDLGSNKENIDFMVELQGAN